MKFLVISLIASVALAGRVCLDNGWDIVWTFTDDDVLSLKVSMSEVEFEEYGWFGIGFKLPSEGSGMHNSDISNIIFHETDMGSDFHDTWAETNGLPTNDVLLGGTDDISQAVSDEEDEMHTFTWNRPVNSGDIFDKLYEEGGNYKLLWAIGYMEGGIQVIHEAGNYGVVDIVLNDDFEYGCIIMSELDVESAVAEGGETF